MRRCSGAIVLAVLFLSFAFSIPRANAQVETITIAAGTDEDRALQAITNEPDSQKKLAMYEDFVTKFSSNPAAMCISPATRGRLATTVIRLWPALLEISTSSCRRPVWRSKQKTMSS